MSKDLKKLPIFIVEKKLQPERKRKIRYLKQLEKTNKKKNKINILNQSNQFPIKFKVQKISESQEDNEFRKNQSSSFLSQGITIPSIEDEKNIKNLNFLGLNENLYDSVNLIENKIIKTKEKYKKDNKDKLVILISEKNNNNKFLGKKRKKISKIRSNNIYYNTILYTIFSTFYNEGSKYFEKGTLISLFNEVLENEINEYSGFLHSLDYISNSNKLKYLNYFKNEKINESNKFLKYTQEQKNSDNNIVIHKNKKKIIQFLKEIPKKIKIKKNKNKTICLHCLKYYNKYSEHIFSSFQNKYCKKIYEHIINEKKFETQIIFFVDLLKYAKKYFSAYKNEDIIKEINLIIKKKKINIPLKNINDYYKFFQEIYISEFGYYFNKSLKKLSKYTTIYEDNLNKIFKSEIKKLKEKINNKSNENVKKRILKNKINNSKKNIKEKKLNLESLNNKIKKINYQKSILEKDYVNYIN